MYLFEDPYPGHDRSVSATISRSPEATRPKPRPECLRLRSYKDTVSCVDFACAASMGMKNHKAFAVLLTLFPIPSCTLPWGASKEAIRCELRKPQTTSQVAAVFFLVTKWKNGWEHTQIQTVLRINGPWIYIWCAKNRQNSWCTSLYRKKAI